MTDLEIRLARRDDLRQIEGVFKSWRPSDWDRKYAKAYFSGYFRDGTSPDAIFVGTLDEKIVGVTGYCPERLETKGIFWLGWHYVHKKIRGQHHGKRLLEHVIDELWTKKSARKLYVNTSSDEFYGPAVGLYTRMGFKQEGVLRDYYGKGEDQILFGMDLRKKRTRT